MKRPLKTLFYGMSHEHAPGKIASLRKLPGDFEIVAVADDRPRLSPSYFTFPFDASGYRVVSEEEARRMDDVDVVFVETANRDLMETARFWAERGVAMHCDKPCGDAFDAYRDLVALCRVRRVPLQIGYMFRANPAVRFMIDAVAKGWIGDVVFAEGDMNHAYGDDSYQRYVGTLAGGLLHNLGCHLVDVLAHFTSGDLVKAAYVKAAAPGDVATANRTSAYLQFPGAEMVIRACSRAAGGVPCRRLRVDGTRGTFDLSPIERFDGEPLRLTLTLAEPAGPYAAGRHEITFAPQTDRYAGQLAELAAIVRGEIPDTADYDHDLRVHALTLAACGLDANPQGGNP